MNIIKNQQTPNVEKYSTIEDFQKTKEAKHTDRFLAFAKLQDGLVGLAANQVEIDGERFMAHCFAMKRQLHNLKDWQLILLPEILETSDPKFETKEGCATWPGKKIMAERFNKIKVRYFNIDSELVVEELFGLEALIFQHEMGHLNGVEENVVDFTIRNTKTVGRNEPCPCGSGKKFKKCCG